MTDDVAPRANDVDLKRRRLLTTATTVVGSAGLVMAAVPFLAAFQPSAKAKAIGAPIEMDVSKLKPGQRIIGKWQGKPVWVVHRTKEAIDNLGALNQRLRDPDSREQQQPSYARNLHRSIKPDLFVVIGLCTHFGCSPQHLPYGEFNSEVKDREGGFFCSCHGSRFDMAGRVYKGVPAPTNLVVPPHRFLSDARVTIGDDGS